MQRLDIGTSGESAPAIRSELRRCACPNCNSTDVWKWGAPSTFDRFMQNWFSKDRLTCRRCRARFYRKVIYVSSERLSREVDPPRLVPIDPQATREIRESGIPAEETPEDVFDHFRS